MSSIEDVLGTSNKYNDSRINTRPAHTLLIMSSDNEVLVTIPQGILRGQKEVTTFGDVYYSFQGIPYAKPPVGELRFKAPQPADGWSGIRDATKSGGIAPCSDIFTGQYMKNCDEDCLFVHVFTKELPVPEEKRPVLVWIHGGGYTVGSGIKEANSPDYFMSHDIVFVSMNYRLGALGFLSLQTPECPGNFGLKDQRLALQWIQNNISYFGGDSNNVTIFGVSAGGSSVHNHMLSPSSKGLFHRAIAQSGGSTNPWGYSRRPRECAYLLGKRLGCEAKNDEELLDFLKNVPAEEISAKSKGILNEIEGSHIGEKVLNFSFTPTCEPESEEAFLTSPTLSKSYQLDVPYITGATEKEMVFEVNQIEELPKWTEDKEYQELIPRGLNVEKDSELSVEIAKRIREFYFKDGITTDGLVDVLSDTYFVHGVYQAIKNRLGNKEVLSPTYAYLFSFQGKLNMMRTFMELMGVHVKANGASHGDDLGYFFIINLGDQLPITLPPQPPLEIGSPEHKTTQRLVQLWVNFATTGAPTNKDSETTWQPIESGNNVYLDIGSELKVKNGFFEERMKFWDDIYKLLGQEC